MDDLGKHPKGMDSTPVRERAMHAAQASTEANFYVYDRGGSQPTPGGERAMHAAQASTGNNHDVTPQVGDRRRMVVIRSM